MKLQTQINNAVDTDAVSEFSLWSRSMTILSLGNMSALTMKCQPATYFNAMHFSYILRCAECLTFI
jgi:hypothetical protein